MHIYKNIFLSFILYCFTINFAFANDDALIISPEENTNTSNYQNNEQSEKIITSDNKKADNINKIQFEDEETIKIEENHHKKSTSIPNRKIHANSATETNNNTNIIEEEMEDNIESDGGSASAVADNEVKKTTEETNAALIINNNGTASGIDYEAKLIEFNVPDKTKHIDNKTEMHFNYNNLLYYFLYVFSLVFIFCLIGLIKEIMKRRKTKMKVVSNEKSN